MEELVQYNTIKLNSTQLRKNTRKRPDKTSGRKRPRALDVDIAAAGDREDERVEQLINVINTPTHPRDFISTPSHQRSVPSFVNNNDNLCDIL